MNKIKEATIGGEMKELKQMERLIDLQAEMIRQLLRELNKKTNPPMISYGEDLSIKEMLERGR